MSEQIPWVAVKDVCEAYGLTYDSALNKIYKGAFPVKTYRVGKVHVIDREVHDAYFRRFREEGLRELESTKS